MSITYNIGLVFLDVMLTAWLTMFLIVRYSYGIKMETLESFWRRSNLIHIFMLLTGILFDDYKIFITSRKSLSVVYFTGCAVFMFILSYGLFRIIQKYNIQNDVALFNNFLLLFATTILSIAFSVLYSIKVKG